MSYRKIFATFLLLSAVLGLPAEKIHVAFCCDNNYGECTGVAAFSVLSNKASDDEIILHIVACETLKEEHRKKFQQLGVIFHGTEVVIYDSSENLQIINESLSGANGSIWGKGSLARLTLNKVLPQDISKVIYLDGDLLVHTSLIDFWKKLPKRPYYVAGVRDSYSNSPSNLNMRTQSNQLARMSELLADPEILPLLYINSGVLLFDLAHIRKHEINQNIIHWIRQKSLRYPDQDGINFGYHGRILECPGKWNTFCTSKTNNPNIAIMHFAGTGKPWKLAEKLNDPNSPVFIAETQGSSSQPVIHTLSRTIPRASASLQQEQRVIFKEKLLAMPKGASIPREAWNVVQQIPEISDMIQRLGCLQEDLSTLNYDLDIAIVGLELQASDDSPLTIPLKISVPTSPIAICALHASLDPQMDSAPAQGEEIRIKSAPGPWILCERDSSYQVIPQKNLWALLTFEGSRRRLSVTLYLHPTSSATSAQLESIRSASDRDWDTVCAAFTSETDPSQTEPIADILDLLSKKEERGLVQNSSDEDTVDLQFSSLWHWYREMSPWKHY